MGLSLLHKVSEYTTLTLLVCTLFLAPVRQILKGKALAPYSVRSTSIYPVNDYSQLENRTN